MKGKRENMLKQPASMPDSTHWNSEITVQKSQSIFERENIVELSGNNDLAVSPHPRKGSSFQQS